ncbi:IclR family transcriptional regulator [Haloferax mediterranei ATCC 33500]|uniref:Transcriptional regulator n=1 Tax=Haloferax mediterranei (strain ATCC 33500 / DSM 1411 / JCM 8866 / NBRC 14739 / NCIMB 2177 / R-4) TaxID=523841 RepID=I3R6J2_HALMT|nr:IclR family transcriptional regulator [Haloferax mediterranei]AFK19852.1 transcription regulator [Haloferax mediterranei ATCC 33500]AHZ23236.1 transcriptional regulator [Haloferax mediterranei ATCC 33500]ELZ99820.1 transcriptional regulator [Haloferax mediterranei ATCC 33500]MDX5987398.1 IclR family transcriptional regulator [Haloferax mediterranei ATCC 33500]QCQ73904.1 IclR family transcriptional regulator [Haloferax mediterranei ATCC 33500]
MDDNRHADAPRRIKSVQTASEILDTIQQQSEPTFSELCDVLDASKGTVHTYLATLEDEGFIAKSDGHYRLGLRFVTMGETVRNETDLYRAGQVEVDKLAEQTSEYVHLTVAYRGKEVTMYESRGDNAVAMDYHLRMREAPQYLHCTSTGKAMLANFDEARVRDIIDEQGLAKRTENTITDPDRLFRELEQIRERGYAVNDEEELRGTRSIGAPVRGVDGDICGAVSVTAPTSRLSGERFQTEIPELVMQTANIIEVNLETTVFEQQH